LKPRGLAGCLFAAIFGLMLTVPAVAAAATLSIVEPSGAVIGQPITAKALLEGETGSVDITFEVFGPGDATCSGPAAGSEGPISVPGEGVSAAVAFTPLLAGDYNWTAHFTGATEPFAPCSSIASNVTKATPTLADSASSAALGASIQDEAILSGGYEPGGTVTFTVFGPGDTSCTEPLALPSTVQLVAGHAVSDAFSPPESGEYRWVASYSGDSNNVTASTTCGSPAGTSVVGTVASSLAGGAAGARVGNPIGATARIETAGVPSGTVTFKAFSPGDTNCSNAPAFTSTVAVSGTGPVRSAEFVPKRVGAFRWTTSYSGDQNHLAAASACGAMTSPVSQASPSITSNAGVKPVFVGAPFGDVATLAGGFGPGGTITFRIFGPTAHPCTQAPFVDTVLVSGNGIYESDPFVAVRPGPYRFFASYSGDAANESSAEPCPAGGQLVHVVKRPVKLKPRAHLIGRRRISIRVRISGGSSPSGTINFRLYRPGEPGCKGKPALTGAIKVSSNRTYALAEYLATKAGSYRLRVGYSGDGRNRPYRSSCRAAQRIQIG
jgi:hypothetical protein